MDGKGSEKAWYFEAAKTTNQNDYERAIAYQNTLTKPPGSLGELESIATRFCAFQATLTPKIEKVCVRVFAGDHGICAQGVSAFPQIVTTQMIENFVRGGAAISVLSQQLNADFSVVNMGLANPLISEEGVVDAAVANGTKDFSIEPAMSIDECEQALAAGRYAIGAADLFIGGEMGIGNTTAATAIYSLLLDRPVAATVGPGTGLDAAGVSKKQRVIEAAINLHGDHIDSAFSVLRVFGGFEIAALTGAYIRCAQEGIPVLVDGFISTAAALLADKLNPSVRPWLLFAHQSAEPAHKLAMQYFDARPILNLGMRLGEGSGAAVAVSIVNSALALHSGMATFAQAGVSTGEET